MRRPSAAVARVIAGWCALFVIGLTLSVTAGAQTAPPPTVVPAPAGGSPSPSPFQTTLRTPPPSTMAPPIGAAAAVVADLDTGQVLFAASPDQRRPIASLTKIMTALLVLEHTSPGEVVTVSDAAAEPSVALGESELGLQPGERISVGQLFFALLLQSANDAADAVAEKVSGSQAAFIAAMNAEAKRLGMSNTRFYSPDGLDDSGFSTARDLVTLTRAAFRRQLFAEVVRTQFHEVISKTEPPRIVQNRNVLLWLYPGATGVKTGFTTAAGFCVVATAERDGRRLVAVVLGEPGEPFSDAAALLNYGFDGFEERTLVRDAESFGSLSIGGHDIPIEARGRLEALVPVDGPQPVRHVEVDSDVPFPPARGEEVGAVTVSAGGANLGTVPLVVAGVPPPPPPPEGPWWRRAASATWRAIGGLVGALLG